MFISHIRYELSSIILNSATTWDFRSTASPSFPLRGSNLVLRSSRSPPQVSLRSDFAQHRLCDTHLSPTLLSRQRLRTDYSIARMETLTTHPSTAQQATAFTSPASLSFPGGAGELTPPSEKDGNSQANGASGAYQNGQQQQKGVDALSHGNGVTPTTPAATPGAGQGVSGLGKSPAI